MAKKKNKEEIQAKIDRGDYGTPLQYDANFLGPRAKRSCTDIICLLLFVCFVIGWIVVGAIAFSQGNPGKIVAPVDSYGRRCGFDEGVEDKKYLLYFDITKCKGASCDTPQVCVENCPGESYVGIYYIETGNDKALNNAICRREKPKDETSLRTAIKNNVCASWYIPFRSIGKRCIYVDPTELNNDALINELLQAADVTSVQDIVKSSQAAKKISQLRKIGDSIVSDMGKNWPILIGGFVIAMVLCMIYIVIMRWFAWVVVWVSLFGVLAILGYCCYATWTKYDEARNANNPSDTITDSLVPLKTTWLIFFIASCIVLVVVLIMIIFLRNRIRIATALISEASRAVGSVMSTLFFPLVPWLLQMGIIAWAIAVWIYLISSGLPTYRVRGLDKLECSCDIIPENGIPYSNGVSCEPADFNLKCSSAIGKCEEASCAFNGYENRSSYGYLLAFNIVGFFWVLCFISAFSDMALAGVFSTWYWTFKKSEVPFLALTYSVGRALRYHIGTLAFGSLILAICRLIRAVLEVIHQNLKKYDNLFTRCMLCCCRCFFWCLERFIIFINQNAYIMCSIHGKNFCRSAHKAFNLLMRNIIRIFVLDKVTDFLLLLGKLLITGGMVALAFYVFSNNVTDADGNVPEYTYYLLPVIIIGVGTYFVTCIFFSVYAMAVDTLFLCFLEDIERNDGSTERPYYMSKKLMKILGKKNAKYKERLE